MKGMFDPYELSAFQRLTRLLTRIFVVLVLLFASGKFILGNSFNGTVGSGTIATEVSPSANLASAADAVSPRESSTSSPVTPATSAERGTSAAPTVSAESYIVASISTGEVYAEKNADKVRSIASISKLVTALAASGSVGTNPTLMVNENALRASGNSANLSEGESLELESALYPLLLSSANDAAFTISGYYGDEFFATLMNKSAREAGMMSSQFVEPSGLSSENVSTARDLYRLAKHIQENRRFIFDITGIEEKIVESNLSSGRTKTTRFHNIHQLRNIEGFIGGKNGFTAAAGHTLLTLFNVRGDDGAEIVAIVVLDSNDVARDSLTLLSWLKSQI